MDQQRYQVVFNSTGIAQDNLQAVIQNFAVLFKLDVAIIAHLFANRPVILKKNVDRVTAERYQVAILKAGAQCSIEPQDGLDSNRVSTQTIIIRCPFCSNLIEEETDKCVHCGTDIKSYISGFKAKGRVFIRGVGIVNDRRKFNRRVNPDRRLAIRFEEDRRIGNDRRAENQYWAGEL
ncbi:MAG TPA: hypothetical protein ENI80_07485 [Acidiferrobacteraceae bacterium]|mgnify:CR=1 FL=1|nr:hypothetical protein [Acidiferrobacteraceae bacterium]